MVHDDKRTELPADQGTTSNGAPGYAPEITNEKVEDQPHNLENVDTHQSHNKDDLPKGIAIIEALGIPDWREQEKKIVRRLDMTLLPQMWIIYMMNFLNRTNIAQARLDDHFEETLNLGNTDYSTAVALLTVGYMLAQLPSNMIITRVRPALYLPIVAIFWSGISAATVAVKSPGELFAVQFILGIFEAPFFPGAVYLLSCWYTRRELALRTALLYSGLQLAQAFSGLIAAGVFDGMSGLMGIAGWQWLFILEGAMSAFFALTAFFILPNYPHSRNGSAMWSMTEDMRRIAQARIEADRVEESASHSVWYGVRLVLTDPKAYIFMFGNICMTSSYGFNNFFPTIVRAFGFGNSSTTLAMTAPPYIWGTIVSFGCAWNSDRMKERGYHVMTNNCIAIVGFIISVATLNAAARYVAAFLYAGGSFSANSILYAWAVSTLSQTPEKRAAGGAIVNIMGHLGNVMSPYFFPDNHAPRYTMAMILQIVFAGLTFCTAFGMKTYLTRANKKIRALADSTGSAYNPFTT